MASIIQQVGTPLQLIALFLLLIVGLARIAVKAGTFKSSPTMTRLIVNRIFQIALISLVLGIAGPPLANVLERRYGSGEQTFHGAVLTASGQPIAGATINVVGVAVTLSNPSGQFAFTIQRDRIQDQYQLAVSASGYEPIEATVQAARSSRSVDLRLKPSEVKLVKGLELDVYVGQFYGLPFVLIALRIENLSATQATITAMTASLSSDGNSIPIQPQTASKVGQHGPFTPLSGYLTFPAGAKEVIYIFLMPNANFNPLFQSMSALPEYASRPPCAPTFTSLPPNLTDGGFRVFETFATNHFQWRAASWTFEVRLVAEGQPFALQRTFTISDLEVKRLTDSVSLARQCLAMNTAFPLAQDGNMTNFLVR